MPSPLSVEQEQQREKDVEAAFERVSAMKTQLLFQQPFFGLFLTNTEVIEDRNIPTAATDGINIYFNLDYFKMLTDQEIKGVLMHEALHMVYLHCSKKRRLNRSPRKWNVAVDYAINWEIRDLQYKLPQGALIDYKWSNMTAEQIYDALPENPKEDSFDLHLDMPDDEDAVEGVQDRIIASYEASKNQGTLPSGVARAIENLRKSRVPWQRVFAKFLGSALSKDDYSFVRPNRRFLSQDLYLPSLDGRKIGKIAIAVDTSGSIGGNELSSFKAEIAKLSALVSEVIVMSCDADVHTYEVIRDMTKFDDAVKFKGGGGTSFVPPFKKLQEKREIPEVFIYLTDGYGDFPDPKTINYPVIWVMTSEINAPFGETVHMDIKSRS